MKNRLEIRFSLRWQFLFWRGDPFIPDEGIFLLDHARSGILLALKVLSIPHGGGIGVMAYNCHTVFNAVYQAGYQPVFIDVTDELRISRKDLRNKRRKINALVVTHLFGIENSIASIRDEFPDLPIIEDCAHAYGINNLSGDFSIFSISQGKFPSIGNGGILVVNNSEYLTSVRSFYDSLPGYTFGQSLTLFLSLLSKALLYSPLLYYWFTRPIKGNRRIKNCAYPIIPKRMCTGISAIFKSQKESINQYINKRLTTAKYLSAVLIGNKHVERILPIGVNAFMLVIQCDNPSLVKRLFQERGIETETHFYHCIDWAFLFGYVKGTCPNTELLSQHLLMIPTYE